MAASTPTVFAEVGERLRAARAKVGMTRRQLATASATSERYLANIESGLGNPSLGVLTGLAAALDLAVADLLPMGGERSTLHAEAASLMRRMPAERAARVMDRLGRRAVSEGSKGRRIVLIGLRGAGKSTLGAALANRLDMPFIEMSKEVARAYGGEIGLLIELGGQSALRGYEHEAWETILAHNDAAVIATPGGVVADAILFERLLATAHSIWLEATPEDHMARVIAQGDFRPMASNRGAMDDLKAILSARTSDYARADARLDTSAAPFSGTLAALERIAREIIVSEPAL